MMQFHMIFNLGSFLYSTSWPSKIFQNVFVQIPNPLFHVCTANQNGEAISAMSIQ